MRIGEKFLDYRSGVVYRVEHVDETQIKLRSQNGLEIVLSKTTDIPNIPRAQESEDQTKR
jgi:hypothetical protein